MRKAVGVILSSILVLCMLVGCNREADDEPKKPEATPRPPVTQTLMPPEVTAPVTVVPSKTTELQIYTISGDLSELIAVTALVVDEQEITEKVVAEAVVAALADNAIYVKVNQVTCKEDIIIVDFDAESPPVSQVGAGLEALILDAFSQSLLDNMADCNAVGFSSDGGDYSSGHFEFTKDDIYMRR